MGKPLKGKTFCTTEEYAGLQKVMDKLQATLKEYKWHIDHQAMLLEKQQEHINFQGAMLESQKKFSDGLLAELENCLHYGEKEGECDSMSLWDSHSIGIPSGIANLEASCIEAGIDAGEGS